MPADLDLKLRLGRIYKIKKHLVRELNDIRKEIGDYVKKVYINESVPESIDFSRSFRDFDYVNLNRFLTEKINLLEEPLSGTTEEILNSEIENIQSVINETIENLTKNIQKINSVIQKLTGSEEMLSLEKYIANTKMKLEKYVDTEIKKELKPDIDKLKEKLKYIYRYEDYDDLLGFLTTFEREVNIYLNQKGAEKVNKIFQKYKERLLEEIQNYIQKYIKNAEKREKVVEEIKEILDEINIGKYSFYYSLPDIKKHFKDINQSISKLDIIISNFSSPRFITIGLIGLVTFIAGFLLPVTEEIKGLITLTGLLIGIYSIIDSAYFNKYYMKKFMKEIIESIKEDVEKSLDNILIIIKDKILTSGTKAENLLVSLVNREIKIIKSFEEYLINLRNTMERHIFNLISIKQELELEISEESK